MSKRFPGIGRIVPFDGSADARTKWQHASPDLLIDAPPRDAGLAMSKQISRREMFDRLSGRTTAIRPPWTLAEAEFERACSPCNDCIKACPEQIIGPGRAGYPVLDFSRRSCTFCGACAEACTKRAFVRPDAGRPAWHVRASISRDCIEFKGTSCRLCEAWCKPAAIRFRPALNGRTEVRIVEDRCTGCGACIAPCPVDAINIGRQIKEEVSA